MMDFRSWRELVNVGVPATGQEVAQLQSALNVTLPVEYVQMLHISNGFGLPTGLIVYAAEDVPERNETFEVGVYAPGYLAIGDDSGGRLVVLHLQRPGVWIVDAGSLHPDDMVLLSASLGQWVVSGFGLISG